MDGAFEEVSALPLTKLFAGTWKMAGRTGREVLSKSRDFRFDGSRFEGVIGVEPGGVSSTLKAIVSFTSKAIPLRCEQTRGHALPQRCHRGAARGESVSA